MHDRDPGFFKRETGKKLFSGELCCSLAEACCSLAVL
jgi:hypothetical protein